VRGRPVPVRRLKRERAMGSADGLVGGDVPVPFQNGMSSSMGSEGTGMLPPW